MKTPTKVQLYTQIEQLRQLLIQKEKELELLSSEVTKKITLNLKLADDCKNYRQVITTMADCIAHLNR